MELPTNPLFDRLGVYPLAAFADKARALRADGHGPVHDFSIGDPVEPTDDRIRQAVKDAIGPVSQYPTAKGQPALREAIAALVSSRHCSMISAATPRRPPRVQSSSGMPGSSPSR